jgi:hypothetical protein
MRTLIPIAALLFSSASFAQELSQDPIGDARIAISQEADFDGARILLEAFESHALEASPPVGSGPIAEMNFLIGVLEFYLNQDEEAAKARWTWTLQIDPSFAWDQELVGGAGETIFESVRDEIQGMVPFGVVPNGERILIPLFIDGRKVSRDTRTYGGQHLVQARCSDGVTRGVYAYLTPGTDLICPCALDTCVGSADGKSGGKGTKREPTTDRSQLGLTLGGGGWYSAGDEDGNEEGVSPLLGAGVSYRPLPILQLDLEGGAYLSQAHLDRTDGGFGAFALSGIYPLGSLDLMGGIHGTLLIADDLYTVLDPNDPDDPNKSKQVESFYTGFIGGVHFGVAYTLSGGHQIGARLGYSPVVIEGKIIAYSNSLSGAYFRYAL